MRGREILIGVSGGIAAFKTAALVSRLVQDGAGVSVVMSEAAGRFVGPATFAALTGRPVVDSVFDERFPLGAHIALTEQADLFCIAPATANFLAQAAGGLAGDALSTIYLACGKPVLVAPAMNAEMWAKAAVQRNVARLQDDGVTIISPGKGWLSCRVVGAGRMAEPDEILAAIRQTLSSAN